MDSRGEGAIERRGSSEVQQLSSWLGVLVTVRAGVTEQSYSAHRDKLSALNPILRWISQQDSPLNTVILLFQYQRPPTQSVTESWPVIKSRHEADQCRANG